mmetsp:Transcript_58607/g.130930  ORF Transcript_58607/g.130930 Transcript_58607/m.130930 type:complete len:215 (-) Transcript_58607:71-715(-)
MEAHVLKICLLAHLKQDQIGRHDFMHRLLVQALHGRHGVEFVCGLQKDDRLVKDEPLQRRHHSHRVHEGQATACALRLQERLHKHGGLVLQNAHVLDLRHFLLMTMGFQALDEPAMLLGEVVVHQVPHGTGTDVAHLILRQGLVGLPNASFNLLKLLRPRPATQHVLQGLLKGCPDFLHHEHMAATHVRWSSCSRGESGDTKKSVCHVSPEWRT